MYDPEILDFEDQMKEAGKKTIIIGNGFGRSFDDAFGKNCFSWDSLLDLCEIEEGAAAYELMAECGCDFELAHQKLNNALEVLKRYGEPQERIDYYQGQIESLREQLVVAVTASHPDSFSSATPEQEGKIRNCRKFLRKFDEIYSLNYDLLLYWVRCHLEPYLGLDSFCNSSEHDDLVFRADDRSNFLFPHGALFLNRNGISATKVRSNKYNPILAVVKKNIRNGTFPMVVSEGTGNQKEKVIRGNEYLAYCFERLEQTEGTVFTFGCSFMDQKDDHIIKQLLRSPADKIIVGEYAPDRAKALRLLNGFEKVQKKQGCRRRVPVHIADSSGVNVW